MMKRWIHAWERALYRRDDNRRVGPFAWGLDHLGIEGENPDPRHRLHRFVERTLRNSDAFFTPPPAITFHYQDGRLTFLSPIQSPWPENNRVWADFFPASSTGPAAIVLPHWNARPHAYVALCKWLNACRISALRLTLPYHEARKPAHLERADYLISANIGRTIQACRQSVLEARLAADWLIERGYHPVGIVGTSIGSCIAFLTFAHDDRFRVGVFNHVSSYFADVVWKGLTTQHVRRSLEPHVELEELRQFWSVISPHVYVPRLRRMSRKALLISARYDLSFPPSLTAAFHRELDRWNVPYDTVILPCGHYTSGVFPFKYLIGFSIVTYLRRHLR
ncbi:MAG: hypothetical protein D6723_10700 [Acidobacteria bacterium]|nr:MAG: hypothetical protein D6723_10700 [Acidobacteriota bacterium]